MKRKVFYSTIMTYFMLNFMLDELTHVEKLINKLQNFNLYNIKYV